MAGYNSNLAASKNYIWSKRDELGSGATGKVYRGMDKLSGQRCAVKVINANLGVTAHQREVLKREIEVIKRLNHVNMVRCLAVEKEVETHQQVIVMELCSGGSLFQQLFDPENKFGLNEDEFILLLRHLVAGMKYMRNENIVHRDIKPGNIMKAVGQDGRPVYKLCDFGAARELKEDESFTSIYGTEEYLHPDIYKEALLNNNPYAYGRRVSRFDSRVDLWSLGITLYHAATGDLPFKPYEGARRDRETMHFLITKKEHGVISGVEYGDNRIEWSKHLPRHCGLSRSLKSQLEPIIAGLVEADAQLATTHDQFFNEIDDLLSRRVVHVFSLREWHHFRLYLRPGQSLGDVMRETEMEMMDTSDQVLLLEGGKELDCSGGGSVADIPSTSLRDPIILWPKHMSAASAAASLCVPVRPKHVRLTGMPGSTDRANPFHDYNAALDAEGDIIAATHLIHDHEHSLRLVDGTVNALTSKLLGRIDQMNELVPHITRCCSQTKRSHEIMMDSVQVVQDLMRPLINGQPSPELARELDRLDMYRRQVENALREFPDNCTSKPDDIKTLMGRGRARDLSEQWDKAWLIKLIEEQNWGARATNEQDLVHEITTQFKKDMETPTTRSGSRAQTHMANTHKWERDNLNRSANTVKDLLEDILKNGVAQMQPKLKAWLTTSQSVQQALGKAEDNISHITTHQTASAEMADKIWADFLECSRTIQSTAASSTGLPSGQTSENKRMVETLSTILHSFQREVQSLSQEVKENKQRADELMHVTHQMETFGGRRLDVRGGRSAHSVDPTDTLMSMSYMKE